MTSATETIDYFAPDGRALRASVQIELVSKFFMGQSAYHAGGSAAATAGQMPGTQTMAMVQAGETMQKIMERIGKNDWKQIAEANGIENPRQLQPGTLIRLSSVPMMRQEG